MENAHPLFHPFTRLQPIQYPCRQCRLINRSSTGDGVALQRAREIAAQALFADQTGGQYWELLAEGLRYAAKEDWRPEAQQARGDF